MAARDGHRGVGDTAGSRTVARRPAHRDPTHRGHWAGDEDDGRGARSRVLPRRLYPGDAPRPIPGPTAGLTRCEYVVPDDDAPALIDALFGEDPASLRRFADARVDLAVRDLIVCTHASVDACCGTFGYPLFQAQRVRHGSGGQVRVWRVSSFGGHRFAPSPIDLPEGRFWGNVEVERMAEIVDRAAPVKQALDMYRGWACLRTPAEQVLERELLDRHGWEWIGRELDLTPIDGSDVVEVVAGTERYEATVEHCSSVPVLIGCDGTAGQVERYSMTALSPMIPVPS